MPSPLVLMMAACAILSAVLIVAGLTAVRRRRWIGTMAAMTLALLSLALASLAGTVSVAMRGYQALTREVVAATVVTQPTGPGRFTATFTFPDGRRERFELAGDAVYVDAHIVKWHPLANVLGLHTAYQLDRVGGRYARIEDEQAKVRRIFALSTPNAVDIFELARLLAVLRPVVDAEYGSATFAPAREAAELELRVSMSGLLFRRSNSMGAPTWPPIPPRSARPGGAVARLFDPRRPWGPRHRPQALDQTEPSPMRRIGAALTNPS